MNQTTDRMIWAPFENQFLWYFIDFETLARLTVFEIELKWVFIRRNVPRIDFALTVSNVQVA